MNTRREYVERIAENTPFWVAPTVAVSIIVPHVWAVVASLRGDGGIAMLILTTYWLSRLASFLAHKYFYPHKEG